MPWGLHRSSLSYIRKHRLPGGDAPNEAIDAGLWVLAVWLLSHMIHLDHAATRGMATGDVHKWQEPVAAEWTHRVLIAILDRHVKYLLILTSCLVYIRDTSSPSSAEWTKTCVEMKALNGHLLFKFASFKYTCRHPLLQIMMALRPKKSCIQ